MRNARARTRDATPEGDVDRGDNADLAEHLEFEIVADVQDATDEGIIPCIELDA